MPDPEACPRCEALCVELRAGALVTLPVRANRFFWECPVCQKERWVYYVRVTLQGKERIGVRMKDVGNPEQGSKG